MITKTSTILVHSLTVREVAERAASMTRASVPATLVGSTHGPGTVVEVNAPRFGERVEVTVTICLCQVGTGTCLGLDTRLPNCLADVVPVSILASHTIAAPPVISGCVSAVGSRSVDGLGKSSGKDLVSGLVISHTSLA